MHQALGHMRAHTVQELLCALMLDLLPLRFNALQVNKFKEIKRINTYVASLCRQKFYLL